MDNYIWNEDILTKPTKIDKSTLSCPISINVLRRKRIAIPKGFYSFFNMGPSVSFMHLRMSSEHDLPDLPGSEYHVMLSGPESGNSREIWLNGFSDVLNILLKEWEESENIDDYKVTFIFSKATDKDIFDIEILEKKSEKIIVNKIKKQNSWSKLSDKKVLKTLDYSAFYENSSGLPKAFYNFFNINNNKASDINLLFQVDAVNFSAKLSWVDQNYSRIKMRWESDFTTLLKQKFPTWNTVVPHDRKSQMDLVFNKTSKDNFYKISFESGKPEMKFGHIDGTKEGQVFLSREELGLSGIHTPPQAGIWGRQDEGSASIVLSGGYADDIDDGEYILYTGQGGRDPVSGKQIKDQEFTLVNKGLQLNKEYNHPVRVTRGHQVDRGPDEGYRYDGLYYVTDYERVKGREGFFVCRFHLQKEEGAIINDDIEHPTSPSERVQYSGNRVKRNDSFAHQIRDLYNNTCQVCKVFLKTPTEGIGISEAAHIKAIGRPHNGPDTKANMICLCPNHHAQFDRYSFYIEPETLEIVGLDEFKGQSIIINKKHKVKVEFFEYQKQQYLKKN